MLLPGLGLGKQVCKLTLRRNKLWSKCTLAVLITHEESINSNVLGQGMLHQVQSNLNGTGVVTMEGSGSRRGNTKVLKKPAQPNDLSSSSHGA